MLIPNPPPQRRADSAAEPVRVWREDAIELGPAVRTPQGYLRTQGAVAVPGILEYETLDGAKTRELIDAEELHDGDSLLSMGSIPVTVDHPEVDVTPDNVGALGVGSVGDKVQVIKESGHVQVVMVIRRRDGLEAAEKQNGRNPELSLGYTTVIDPTPGEHPIFGRYDARQTKRRYNHLAIVDEARGGHSLQMRVDGAKRQVSRLDAISTPESTPSKPPAGGFMNPTLVTLAALLSLPFEQKKDGKVFRTDQEGEAEEVPEAGLLAAVADAIRGLQDATAAGSGSDGNKDGEEEERLKGELQAALAKVAELEGALDVLNKAKADADEEAQAKADKAERTSLDALAKKMNYDTAAWRDDTKNVDRKLDLVRHGKYVEKNATPDAARVDGMIDMLLTQHADKKEERADDGGAWSTLNDQTETKPRTDATRDDGTKRPDDPFKARLAKNREDAKANRG